MESTTRDTAQAPFARTASPVMTPTKSRSFSDPPAANTPPTLQPSPTFLYRTAPQSKDDHALPTTPKPTRRPEFMSRLSLQMPAPPTQPVRPVPLSPRLDQQSIYMQRPPNNVEGSPSTSLPRHSRGLDFSRACTNLHHSTIAESSPDSSPVILQRGLGMMIPGTNGLFSRSRKGSISSMMLVDSPNINAAAPGNVPWGGERSTISSSVGSVNMLASESESSNSDDDASMAGDETEDPMFTTPQVQKLQNPNTAATPFGMPLAPSTPSGGGAMWANGGHFSPAQTSLMKTIRRSKLPKSGKRGRKSSSSASGSGYSSMASPRTTSPPPMRSIESAASGSGYFNWATAARSRRESLAMGTDGLHLSSGNDSGDEASQANATSTPGVVRRAVTRRGNLLPKTKGFARIRAALLEEAAPVDTESRREAETIRQVRERDGGIGDLDFTNERAQTFTEQSSPNLLPAVPESIQEDFGRDLESESSNGATARGLGMDFAVHATRNSGGLDYWNRFDPSLRTPPPPSLPRQGSSNMSDINMDSEPNNNQTTPLWRRPRAQSSASDASEAFAPNTSTVQQPSTINDDMHLKKFKRRREDDFDIATIKRRAVSPGMSAQNSPVMQTHSPSQKEAGTTWGQPPERRQDSKNLPLSAGAESSQVAPLLQQTTSQQGSRHGSAGSIISLTPSVSGSGQGGKKLGLQGMVDTNDGLMKMSIE